MITGATRAVRTVGVLAFFALALILAACGGGEDVTSSPGSTAVSAPDTEVPSGSIPDSRDIAGDPGGDTEKPDSNGNGEMSAVVVIGDEQFEFDMSAACISIGGAVGGTGFTADGSVRIEIDIPPADWETSADGWDAPAIRVQDERDDDTQPDWRAGGEVLANYDDLSGIARVDTFSVEGSRASGSATFVDLAAYDLAAALGDPLPGPVAGTFEINCG